MVLSLATGPAALALQTAQSDIVSADPADFTPNVLDGEVDAIAQMGNTIILGGTFTQAADLGVGMPVLTRNHILAFDATTGIISTTFVPQLDGDVETLLPSGDGTSLFVGGDFTTVNGVASKSLTKLNLADGSRTSGFSFPRPDGVIKDMRLVHGQVVVAGNFKHVGFNSRSQLASLNPTTGALTSFVNFALAGTLHPTDPTEIVKVSKIDVSADGSKLLGIGDFKTVNGASRPQIFLLNTSGAVATLSPWQTSFFTTTCSAGDDTYMRAIDISPDGTYAVATTTGGYHGVTGACDTNTRWDLTTTSSNLSPQWTNVTGGDTSQAVAITGTAVYVGGHFRWANNPYSSNAAGPGAVPREGLVALDPTNGLPLTWNPGRARGVGVFSMLATSTGLWVGNDTTLIGGETHARIAFFPLAGGVTPPANLTGALPEDVYLMGAPTSARGALPVTWGDTINRQFWIGPGSTPEATATPSLGGAWNASRGSFLVDSTVYSGWSDGTLQARSFDGATLGAPTNVELYASTFVADLPTITGIFYANNRIYYTMAGDTNLYTRTFTPQSQVVGSIRYTVTGASPMNAANITGMFLSGSSVYFANAASGNLLKVTLTGATVQSPGTINGPATTVETATDWRARGAFVWNGQPATRVNTPPTAVATSSCVAAACTFSGTGSFDPDGHLVSYAWDFGDGTTTTGPTASHSYVAAGTYSVSLTVTDFQGATDTDTLSVHPVHSQYTAIGPCRVFDTRTGHGSCSLAPTIVKAPVGPGGTLSVKVTGVANVPATATAVVLNVTAVSATAATFVTVFPHGGSTPLASNLNVNTSAPTPNLVIVPVGAGGIVDFYNAKGNVELLADIAGYFSPTSTGKYAAVGPCRLFDTRTGSGVCPSAQPVTAAPLGAGQTLSVLVRGVGTVPTDATAVVLNVTGVQSTATTFVTVSPSLVARPLASNLNLHNAGAVANLVVVPIGSDGKVNFYNDKGTVNLIADVAGYFSPSATPGYTPTGPCRVFDTRTGTGSCLNAPGAPKAVIAADSSIAVKVTGMGGVPDTATAVVLNVTAVDASATTFVTVWPDGDARPLASNLNVSSKPAVPNLVIVPIGAGGMIDFYNANGHVNVVADIAGYFSP